MHVGAEPISKAQSGSMSAKLCILISFPHKKGELHICLLLYCNQVDLLLLFLFSCAVVSSAGDKLCF